MTHSATYTTTRGDVSLATALLADYFDWSAAEALAQLDALANECRQANGEMARLLLAIDTRDLTLSCMAAFAAERWLGTSGS